MCPCDSSHPSSPHGNLRPPKAIPSQNINQKTGNNSEHRDARVLREHQSFHGPHGNQRKFIYWVELPTNQLPAGNKSRLGQGKRLFYQLLFSLFSATIFYITFNLIPENRKRKKLRPIVIRDLILLKQELFHLICTTMKTSKYDVAASYQKLIQSGQLSEKKLQLGMQNKCFSEHYLYDRNISQHLIPIGSDLRNHTDKSVSLIDKIFNLSEFATAEEILLIEEIRTYLNMYTIEIELHPGPFRPLVTSCSYLAHAYYPLYLCYIKLQSSLLPRNPRTESDALLKASFLYSTGAYKECKKLASAWVKKGKDQIFSFKSFEMDCTYMTNNKDKAYGLLRNLYKSRGQHKHLVSTRHHVKMFLDDEIATQILIECFDAEDYERAKRVLDDERSLQLAFEANSQTLFEYFAALTQSHRQEV